MPRGTVVQRRTEMPVSAEALFAWHERPGAFERLTPGFMPARVLSRSGGITDGSRVTLGIPVGPVTTTWEMEHVGYVQGREFRDVQRSGPFAHWEHIHRMEPLGDSTSVLDDRITYALPLPPFGDVVAGWFTRERLERLLQWRHALTKLDLERHAQFAAQPRLRIAVTGASGFLGTSLCAFLTTGGHSVLRIGRGRGNDVHWDPARGQLDASALEGVDAVIHLAGSSVAERWTSEHKRSIRESRVQSTRLIAQAIAKLTRKPRVLLSGSAIGIYGSRADEVLDESSTLGDDFLADVGREWEAETRAAEDAGVRVVHLRTGIVLNPAGGALAKMVTPFQAGVGGKLGSGAQWMSWISREDWIGAAHHALFTDTVRGAVNLVGPEPVTAATFAATLARVLGRPNLFPVPAFALKTLFGEMAAGTILASQRVMPKALQTSGFAFAHPSLATALRFELGLL
ncbi:TIGR01777 family oxidoreductase [Pseudogemmatithrix spongiicola]|uniref:TIGR01777 family oxidoreductase n=1 Tax=Pseudogemmatithrix spongiicola TaxID=3062599 RepID=A0AA49Q7A3_9BACT|nr:TIGR01777 family oxidoreductase [Gemmatimonadaceae bacterium 'strain 138']WKW13875.1 TIGR01777 family oxidoreductase [Gemmatimonadaceae bacterium 'strain 318']